MRETGATPSGCVGCVVVLTMMSGVMFIIGAMIALVVAGFYTMLKFWS